MKISYQTTLQDVAEPQIRSFLRSQTFIRQRIFESALALVFVLAVLLAFQYLLLRGPIWWLTILLAISALTARYVTHENTVRNRITGHVWNELGDQLPYEVEYLIQDERLKYTSPNMEISVSLSNLESVTEDLLRIELSFGAAALCTIPQRAFPSKSEKTAFLQALEAGKKSQEN